MHQCKVSCRVAAYYLYYIVYMLYAHYVHRQCGDVVHMQCLICYNALNETAHTIYNIHIIPVHVLYVYIPVVLNMQWSVNTCYAPNWIPSRSPTAHNDVPCLAASGSGTHGA